MAGIPTMCVKVIRGHLTPGQMLQMNLAENIQRCSLNPIEKAKAFRRLMQLEDLTATEAAARMNVSNATVSRDLSLLDLPESLQCRVASGTLPASVAAALARLEDDEARRDLADQYCDGRRNRDGIVAEVGALLKPGSKPDKKPRLGFKIGGLSISVCGKREKLTVANLTVGLRPRLQGSQGPQGCDKTDVAELSQLLRAS